jgi:hypothetical protein
MSKKTAAQGQRQAPQSARRAEPDLDSRYGEIGISAVAAALRYQGEVRNPADAPAPQTPDRQLDKWIAEVTAA